MMKSLKRIQRGFTLIELLIVIAVLGVLAAVVLAAINPLEQLKRGRDSGRLSGVAQLGHAFLAYQTSTGATTYPTTFTTGWQSTVKAYGELVSIITSPSGATACTASGNLTEGGYCYASNGTDFVIWTGLEASSNQSKATCGSIGVTEAAFIGSQGKAGVVCAATAGAQPSYTATLY